jgi:hypothetical protein
MASFVRSEDIGSVKGYGVFLYRTKTERRIGLAGEQRLREIGGFTLTYRCKLMNTSHQMIQKKGFRNSSCDSVCNSTLTGNGIPLENVYVGVADALAVVPFSSDGYATTEFQEIIFLEDICELILADCFLCFLVL